jgi:predicted Ser/Thr protein kinase
MTTFGKYQVVEQIGEGGFGKVYRGQDPVLKRPVAIKTCTLLHDEMRERFVREAEIAANLRHPNILTVYDFGEESGEPYLVQEYLPGEDLDEVIRRADLVPLATKVGWLSQIAHGLRHAHENGVVHRDVKPANIRILPDGQVRIMDFGIAKLLQADRQLTQMGFSVGTTGYLAPEQLKGEEIDHRADIFAFGVLAYELVTYRRPFEAETITAILYRIAHEEPQPLLDAIPGCPPRLAACIERCLRKNREERWASFAPVIQELDDILREIGAIGAAAELVGGTRAFATATGGGAPGEASPKAGKASPGAGLASPRPGAGNAPLAAAGAGDGPGGSAAGRRWRPSPAFLGLAAATVGVAVFGVLNITRWAESSTNGGELQSVQPPAVDPNAPPVDSASLVAGAEGVAAGTADDTAAATNNLAGTSGRDSVPPATTGTGGSPPPTTGQDRGTPTPPRTVPDPAPAALQPGNVLVLTAGGPEVARGVAESMLIAELLRAGLAPVDDETSATMQDRLASAQGVRDLGQLHATGTVLSGDLRAQAGPGVGRFYTGTATFIVRAYDANTGRLLGTQTFQVGAGGVPGKSGATEDAAITEAAEAVAYQASRWAANLVRDRD